MSCQCVGFSVHSFESPTGFVINGAAHFFALASLCRFPSSVSTHIPPIQKAKFQGESFVFEAYELLGYTAMLGCFILLIFFLAFPVAWILAGWRLVFVSLVF